ncbi:unnamed protein product, partial [Brugia timori]|uniref:SMN domain-containing protein n=1 Tax=Brugia timori TaxID=42155 RepID=A0A0R3QBA2_9BILA
MDLSLHEAENTKTNKSYGAAAFPPQAANAAQGTTDPNASVAVAATYQQYDPAALAQYQQAWQQYYAAVGQAGIAGGVPGVAPPGAGSVPTAIPQGVPAATADVGVINVWIFISSFGNVLEIYLLLLFFCSLM